MEYTNYEKQKMADRIMKIKKQHILEEIQGIILKHNPDIQITRNRWGQYMYFHNLKSETYEELDKLLTKLKIKENIKLRLKLLEKDPSLFV